MHFKSVYQGGLGEGAEVVAGRLVDVVGVDGAELRVGGGQRSVAFVGGEEERVERARLVELGVRRVADQPVVPPVLERADVVVEVVDQRIAQLEFIY